MAFQPVNFLNAPMIDSWAKDLDIAGNFKKGAEAARMPQDIKNEQMRARLANSMQEAILPYAGQTAAAGLEEALLKNKYYGPKTEADIAMNRAHAKQYEAQSMLPGGGAITGDILQSLLTEKYANDPNVPQATKDRVVREREALIRQRLMGNTPFGAKIREDDERISNDSSLSGDQKREAIAANRAHLAKTVKNATLQNQGVRAEITQMGFDELTKPSTLKALTQYGGYQGALRKELDEKASALTGKSPQRLLDYTNARTIAENTAMNLRAAINESVQPEKGKAILAQLDAANWDTAPDRAIATIKAAAKFFEREKAAIDRENGKVLSKVLMDDSREIKSSGGAHNDTMAALEKNTRRLDEKYGKPGGYSPAYGKSNVPRPKGSGGVWNGRGFE